MHPQQYLQLYRLLVFQKNGVDVLVKDVRMKAFVHITWCTKAMIELVHLETPECRNLFEGSCSPLLDERGTADGK